MREMLPKAKSYSVVILRGTKKMQEPGADKVIWEHGRRNFQLRADGLLSIVCPIRDGSGVTHREHFAWPAIVARLEVKQRILDAQGGVDFTRVFD
jgi:hypothetical protein